MLTPMRCSKPLIVSYRKSSPQIDSAAFIAPRAVLIGDVSVGADASIWFGCTLRGDVNDIMIGRGSNIQDGTVVHVASQGQGTYIGERVTVGHMALLHACDIEDEAFIGMKACVMDGARVEKHAMVAAGALVTPGKVVASGELWGGVPAVFMRKLTVKEKNDIVVSADHYMALARSYRSATKEPGSQRQHKNTSATL